MRPGALVYLYARRLRTHPVQELLAGAGVAIGVALTFAVQVANHSVVGSAAETARSLAGSAGLQLSARSPAGVPEGIVQRVRALDGVRHATGVLEQRAVATSGGRRAAVNVAGVRPGAAELGGLVGTRASTLASVGDGVVLPSAIAADLGLEGGAPRVRLELRGRSRSVAVAAVAEADSVGAFAQGRVLVMRRSRLQRLAGLPGRVTRILIQARPGGERAVRARLRLLGAGRLTVGTPVEEVRLLAQATEPADRATAFFTLIAALVGWLLAFNAMLLSAQERRRVLAELRMQGFRAGQLVQVALFQAALLGSVASAVGLGVGMLLARGALTQTAGYLQSAFDFGTQTVVPVSTFALTFAGGVAAACLAAAPPLLSLRLRAAPAWDDAQADQSLQPARRRGMLGAALALVAATGALLALAPATAIVAIVALALALPLALPTIFAAVVHGGERAGARSGRLALVVLALLGLRATTTRSLALAATGALAVFGSVAVASSRDDLLRGIDRFAAGYTGAADLWIAHAGDNQGTRAFPAAALAERVAAVTGVGRVRAYHGGFVDLGGRRAWLVAPPAGGAPAVPASEIERGAPARAARRLRRPGWIVVSERLARALGSGAGETLVLPTPAGRLRYRIAATTTNFGWSAGAVVVGPAGYRRGWGAADPTALQVLLRPGASIDAVAAALRRRLGPASALVVQKASERARQAGESAREGLARLGQIALLLLVGAALAMAAAMSAAIWQRRPSLAALRLQGLRPGQLWVVLLAESAVVLGAGCVTGALGAVYGQFLIDRYLRLTTGFAAPFEPAGWPAVEALLLVMAMALGGVALPGWVAARTPARLGLGE